MIALNPSANVQLINIGKEQNPLLIIDNFVIDPEYLIEFADNSQWFTPEETLYPGLNANLPEEYLRSVITGLGPSFSHAFKLDLNRHFAVNGFFALTTYKLEQFQPWQRIPHFDSLNSEHIAVVHYLGKNQTGGTGFFRHIETGYESISTKRRDFYVKFMENWISKNGDSLITYAGEKTPGFEMYFHIPFKFNRAVIYPSNILHCALYDGSQCDTNPKTGRLTANSFWVPV